MTKRLAFAALLLAIAVALYFLTRPAPRGVHENVLPEPPAPVARESATTPSAAAVPREQAAARVQADAGTASSGGERPQSSAQQTKTATSPAAEATMPPAPPRVEEITGPDEELENVQFMVRGYRDVLGENPFGTNAEITRALMGENARQVKMPLPVGSHLNESGELVDRWGTPYFFHQLSGTEMEVRSAGLDQQMWTSDDLVTR